MASKVLRRRSPPGAGLEASLSAMQGPDAGLANISQPPEEVDALMKEGESFTFDSFTTTDAWEIGHLLHARLITDTRSSLISVTLDGVVIFQAATGPGVTSENESWVSRKRRTVLRWGCSTWLMHCKFRGDEGAFASQNGFDKEEAASYAIHGGAVPIYIQGSEGVRAVVVVSGLKQHEDHGCIADVIKANWEPVS